MFELSLDAFRLYLPLLAMLAVCLAVLSVTHWLLIRRKDSAVSSISRQLMMSLTGVTAIFLVLALPVGEATKGDLLSLVFTGVFALSATTFVANAMAGFILGSVKSFRYGDFVRVGEHFGRVTVSGLFYTEIQSEERDLITPPNLYSTSQALTVVRSSGTFTSLVKSPSVTMPPGTQLNLCNTGDSGGGPG